MRDMADAHRRCWGVMQFMMAWSCCCVGLETSWLSGAIVVQDGDNILLSVAAMSLCSVVVKISLLMVVRVSLLVVTVSAGR